VDLGHIDGLDGGKPGARQGSRSAEGFAITLAPTRCYGEIAESGDTGWVEGEKLGEKSGGVWADDCWYFMATAQGRRMG